MEGLRYQQNYQSILIQESNIVHIVRRIRDLNVSNAKKNDLHLSDQMPQTNSQGQIAADYPKQDSNADGMSRKHQWRRGGDETE